MSERVRVLHNLPFVAPGGEEVLVAGTVLDTIPKTKGGVLAAASRNDDVSEILGFLGIGGHKRKVTAGLADVLAVWRGKIRFLRVGEDVEFVGPQGRR